MRQLVQKNCNIPFCLNNKKLNGKNIDEKTINPSDVAIMLKLYLDWNGSAVLFIKYILYIKGSVLNCSLPV